MLVGRAAGGRVHDLRLLRRPDSGLHLRLPQSRHHFERAGLRHPHPRPEPRLELGALISAHQICREISVVHGLFCAGAVPVHSLPATWAERLLHASGGARVHHLAGESYTMRGELIGHFKPCMTGIYLPI